MTTPDGDTTYKGISVRGCPCLAVRKKAAHPMNMGDCLAWARRILPILARPNDKSGMTLKPCTSAQFQHNLEIRNILDTTKNSSASCVFIIRLLK